MKLKSDRSTKILGQILDVLKILFRVQENNG